MLRVRQYRQVAPFTLEELVESANALIGRRRTPLFTPRTVRFYISKGILSGPSGPPKFSRYEYGHLLRLLAARALQDEGALLEDVAERLDVLAAGGEELLERTVERFVDDAPRIVEDRRFRFASPVQENPSAYGDPPRPSPPGKGRHHTRTSRLHLTSRATLELVGEPDDLDLLLEARAALDDHIEDLT